MCFSTEASFIAAGALATVGVVAMKKTAPSSGLLAFAAIPFLFAVQQLSEGFEWLAFNGKIDESWLTPSKYIFLLFAQVIWPAWVPFAIFRAEREPGMIRLLTPFVVAGFGLGLYHLYCLFTYNVTAEVSGHHILYRLEYLQYGKAITNVVYFATVVIPPFLSSNRRMQLVGLANFISFLVTFLLYREHLLSVWCYFAALISATVLWAVYPQENNLSSDQRPASMQ
jgi:hypothetical protein